jgi:hypothetical protein
MAVKDYERVTGIKKFGLFGLVVFNIQVQFVIVEV